MKKVPSWFKSSVQLALCGLLLALVFQRIFWKEGMDAWEREQRSPSWNQLTRTQRLEVSWSHGPREVWRAVSRVRPEAFAVSLALMGATILLGIVRWRQVLRVHGLELSFARAAEIARRTSRTTASGTAGPSGVASGTGVAPGSGGGPPKDVACPGPGAAGTAGAATGAPGVPVPPCA